MDRPIVALGRLEDDGPLHRHAVRADRLALPLAAHQASLQQGPRHQIHVVPGLTHLPHRTLHPHDRLPAVPDLGVDEPPPALVRVAAARLAVGTRRLTAHESGGSCRPRLDQSDHHRAVCHRDVRAGGRLPAARRRPHDLSVHPKPTVRPLAHALLHPASRLPVVPLPVRAVGHHHPRPYEGPHPLPSHSLHLHARLHPPVGRHLPPNEAAEPLRPRPRHGRWRRRRAHRDAARHVRIALFRPVRARGAGEPAACQPPPHVDGDAREGRVRRLSDHHPDRAHQPAHRHDVGHVPAHSGAVGHRVEVRPGEVIPEHEPDLGDSLAYEPAHETLHLLQDTHQTQRCVL